MAGYLIAFMAFVTVVLGALAYRKLQRATGGVPDTEKTRERGSSPLPRELQELQIEQPQENVLDYPEEPEGKHRGQQGTSGHSVS